MTLDKVKKTIKEANACNDPNRLMELVINLSGYTFWLAEEVGKLHQTYIDCEGLRKEIYNNKCVEFSEKESMSKAEKLASQCVGDARSNEIQAKGLYKSLEWKLQSLYENIWSLRKKIDYLTSEKINIKND